MLVITGSTQKELARQVSYLKAENGILRSRVPDRISLTQREKNRLVRFAKNLGSALNELARRLGQFVFPENAFKNCRSAERQPPVGLLLA